MPDQPYFDQSGEISDAPGRFFRVADLEALELVPGLAFRPVTTESVMANFVSFVPDAPAPIHHHSELQIAIVLSGELHFTVGEESRVMRAGDCVVIPPHVPHGGHSGPDGCEVIDVFSPPRAGIVNAMGPPG
jgi:quercetin dioxygenase-like cupin family protein